MVRTIIPDKTTAMVAAIAISSALFYRRMTWKRSTYKNSYARCNGILFVA